MSETREEDPAHAAALRMDALRRELEQPLPHPDASQTRQLAASAVDWLTDHFNSLPAQTIGRTASRTEMEILLREPPPQDGRSFAQVLEEFTEQVVPYAFRVNHPRFLAFIPSAPTIVSVLGDMLCAGTNFFGGVWLEAAGPSQVEIIVLDWLKQFLGFPNNSEGILTSGGSEANLTALVAAREVLSYPDHRRAILYVAQQRHWSVDRAAKIAGFAADQIRVVPEDDQFRLRPAALRPMVLQDRASGRLPWLVVANAGATNTGTVDALNDLADFCNGEKLWLHVDAAYGWSAVLDGDEKLSLKGIERAHSLTMDPHKWFGQCFEAGCVLVRQPGVLARAFALRPDYMKDVEPAKDEVNFADRSLALTRRFRALKIWLSIKTLGVDWYRALVRHSCHLAELAELLLRAHGSFEILCERRLSIVCFRFVPSSTRLETEQDQQQVDELNLKLLEALRVSGKAFISSTRLRGRVALRFCFVNWRTTAADVEAVIALLAQMGTKIVDDASGGR
jgi:glutamate/tyrosine decarboxylase-like PLP-dependent enzyme